MGNSGGSKMEVVYDEENIEHATEIDGIEIWSDLTNSIEKGMG